MTPTNTMVAVQLARQAAPRPVGTYLPNPHPLGADQTTAINTVLASGGTIIVGDRYRVDGQLNISSATTLEFSSRGEFYSSAGTSAQKMIRVTASDVHLIGSGKITGPQYAAAANQTLVSFEGTNGSSPLTNVSVKGLTLSQSGKYGILATYVKGFAFDRNTVKNCCYTGIGVLSGINGSIDKNVVENITQTGYSNSYGIFTSRNEVDLSANDPRSESISICTNRVIDVPGWDGINTHAGKTHTISNNVVINCAKPIELVAGQITGGVEALAPLDMTVSGNVITSTVSNGTRAGGIMLVGADGVGAGGGVGNPAEYATGSITGNIVRGHGDEDSSINAAILLYYTKGVTIEGNVIIEPSPTGIGLYHTNIGFTCIGNTIIDPWTTAGATCAAINCVSSYNVGNISGNNLKLNGKSATLVAHRGISIADFSTNIVSLGSNDMSDATTALRDTGHHSVSTISNPSLWVPSDNALIAGDIDPALCSSTLVLATAGVIYLRKLRMAETKAITNVISIVTSGGNTLANTYVGVYDNAGTRLGVSADASTAYQGTGTITTALSAPTAVQPAGSYIYVAILIGSWVTAPTIASYPSARIALNLTTSNIRWGSVSSGLTALPSTITPGSIASVSSAVPMLVLS